MKKVALILAVISAVLLLVSCGKEKEENSNVIKEDVYVDVNSHEIINKNSSTPSKKTYEVTPGLQDYDSEGNLIVKSTENRYVYRSDLGYVIFSFNQSNDSCIQVLEVRKLESEEAATNYLTENVVDMMSSGNYLNVNQAKHNVVFTVSFENPIYGKYLALTRSNVEKDMPEEMKCN